MLSLFGKIFKKGSKTYFYSSIFFPPAIRKDVFILYSFVRTADDFVDQVPAQKEEFTDFCTEFERTYVSGQSESVIIESFVKLMKRRNFKKSWVDAFLAAMKQDLTVRSYGKFQDVEKYMHGSAEVIGLMMARILSLPSKSLPAAQMLGKAMQYINFLRDIEEDNSLSRTYIPIEYLKTYKLSSLKKSVVLAHPKAFCELIRAQLQLYEIWQKKAEKGFSFIPKRYRIPIQTASDMYCWTAQQIAKNPQVVFEKKVKPSVARIVLRILHNTLFS